MASLQDQLTGTYTDARLLLSLAMYQAGQVALDTIGDSLWAPPDRTSRENLMRELVDESNALQAPGIMPDSDCPDWLYVRSLWERSHAISEGAAEVSIRRAENVDKAATDVAQSAKEIAVDILTPTTVVVAGLIAIVLLWRKATA